MAQIVPPDHDPRVSSPGWLPVLGDKGTRESTPEPGQITDAGSEMEPDR